MRRLNVPLDPYVEPPAPPVFPEIRFDPTLDDTAQQASQFGSTMGGVGRNWWNKRQAGKRPVMSDSPMPWGAGGDNA